MNRKRMIYLDNNATTPLAEEVRAAMIPYLGDSFGNPSSAYDLSGPSRTAIRNARLQVAEFLGAEKESEIVFTSGGTESDNWAIRGALAAHRGRNHIITTRVEHEAVRNLCRKLEKAGRVVTWLDVDSKGRIDPDELTAALREDTAVVSIMMANNETGVLFPVDELAAIVNARSDALFHVDGVNAAGKIPLDLKNSDIDLFSISGHKFHGPKGAGALYVRDGVDLPANAVGGGQEGGRRAGTEAVHQIAGVGAAALFASDLTEMAKVRELRDLLEVGILGSIPGSCLNGDPESRLPNTTNISFAGLNGEVILSKLNSDGICVSTGSACNEESRNVSPVLKAMNVPFSKAMGAIRFSLGRFNTREEIDATLERVSSVISELSEIRP